MPKAKSHLSVDPWRKVKLRRSLETPEKRALRLEKQRIRAAKRRARETEQEREDRLARCREAVRLRRANTKQSKGKVQRKIALVEVKSKERARWEAERKVKKGDLPTKEKEQKRNSMKCKCPLNHGFRKPNMNEEKNPTNGSRRIKTSTSLFSAGIYSAQNHPLQMIYDKQHMAYDVHVANSCLQSQLQQKLMTIWPPRTPKEILHLLNMEYEGLAKPGENLAGTKTFTREEELNEVDICGPAEFAPILVDRESPDKSENLAGDEENIMNDTTEEEEILGI